MVKKMGPRLHDSAAWLQDEVHATYDPHFFTFSANRSVIGYHEPNGNGPGILMAVLIVGICLNIAYIVIYLNLDSILR